MYNSSALIESRHKQHEVEQHSEQQGFFSQKIQIRQAHFTNPRSHSVTKSFFNKTPFQAKFLPWTGVMKKQPVQSFNVSNPSLGESYEKLEKKKKNKNIIQDHPYKLYVTNQNYQLVYCRYKGDPLVNDKFFMSNQVKLQHVGGKNVQYKKCKQFDFVQKIELQPGTLSFDSRFQCGNLHCAYKNVKQQEYILFMENDTNSLGYNQWFYFSIQHNQSNLNYTFRIVNFKKKHSFFKYGCKPAVFSMYQAKTKNQGWSKKGKNVIYEQSPIYIQQLPDFKFYSLSFELSFEQREDFILIAMSFPYSYTKLISFLKQVQMIAQDDQLQTLQFSIKSICPTVCGNDVPQITITRKSEQHKKKMIIIMARQHPGQVWSSYMAQGMIRKLVSKPDEDTEWLLNNYVFKIYPMVNVDGVIYGNFRCDITGFDLNRRWKQTSKLMHPQVHQIKRRVGLYRSRFKIQACFDLHGHSKNYNIFCYSCKQNQYTCRLLPLIISKINPIFDFSSCTFGISKYKETTARAAIYKLIKNQNVLTIQSSFYGSKFQNVIQQFGPNHLFRMGQDILNGSKHFLQKNSKLFSTAKKQIQNRINQFISYDKIHEEDSGSESDPSGDQIDLQTKIKLIFNKQLVTIDQLKGIKIQKPKPASINIKIQQQFLEVKGKQYKKNANNDFNKSTMLTQQAPINKNQSKTIQSPQVYNIRSGSNHHTERKNEKTISYSIPRSIPQKNTSHMKVTNSAFRQRQRNFSVHPMLEPKSGRISKDFKNSITFKKPKQEIITNKNIQSLADQQFSKSIQQVRKSDQFIKKFQRFIPISLAMKNKVNMAMFEQYLYNEDQSNLISMLLQNKRKIQLQKIKRNVQKSTYLVERQGKIKVSSRKQKVVDFKSFKQNEKINEKIRKLANINYNRYDQ